GAVTQSRRVLRAHETIHGVLSCFRDFVATCDPCYRIADHCPTPDIRPVWPRTPARRPLSAHTQDQRISKQSRTTSLPTRMACPLLIDDTQVEHARLRQISSWRTTRQATQAVDASGSSRHCR